MKFLVDAQLPPALARWLAEKGHAAWHVTDLGLGVADDTSIWRHAGTEAYILISKDEDFTLLQRVDATAQLIWVTLGNCSKSHLLSRFEAALPQLLEALAAGEQLIELR